MSAGAEDGNGQPKKFKPIVRPTYSLMLLDVSNNVIKFNLVWSTESPLSEDDIDRIMGLFGAFYAPDSTERLDHAQRLVEKGEKDRRLIAELTSPIFQFLSREEQAKDIASLFNSLKARRSARRAERKKRTAKHSRKRTGGQKKV